MLYTSTLSKDISEIKENYYKIIKIIFREDELEFKENYLKDICGLNKECSKISETKNIVYLGFYNYKGFNNFREKNQIYRTQKMQETEKLDISQIKLIPYEALVLPGNSKLDVNFFDENGILHSVPLTKSYGIVNGVNEQGKINVEYREIMKRKMFGSNNLHLVRCVLKNMKSGDTFQKFLNECEKISYETLPKLYSSELERFVGRIDKVCIEREPENLNKNTFDFIRIKVYLNKLDSIEGSIKENAKKYLPDITNMILEKIKHNKYFQKYNIPIEFLKISKITLTKDATLEFIFELKEFCIEENKYFETEDNNSIKRR